MNIRLPEKKRFFSADGGEAECLSDLKQLIIKMSEDSFKNHLKNQDFSNWIRDVLHKDSFAESIKPLHSKEDLIVAMDQELEKELQVDSSSFFFKRFMAKNFIYGLILGLLVGVALTLLAVL